MPHHTLHLEEPVTEVLACGLVQVIDDLEARAVICAHHDPTIGPASAEEYRNDARRLRSILDVIAPGSRPADPEQVAVLWIDGTWTVSNGRPVRLRRSDDLECLLESNLDLVDLHLLDPHDALIAIHYIVTTDPIDIDTPDIDTTDLDPSDIDTTDLDPSDIDTPDLDTTDLDTTDLDTMDLDTTDDDTRTELDLDLTPNVQTTTEIETSSPLTRQVIQGCGIGVPR